MTYTTFILNLVFVMLWGAFLGMMFGRLLCKLKHSRERRKSQPQYVEKQKKG